MDEKPLFISITKKSYIRATQHLSESQVIRLFKASEKAFQMGCPLNRFITIHYDDYADKKRPQKFVTNYLEHARKWLKRRGLPVAYLYTLENGKTKGIHVHLLIHVPNGKTYKAFKNVMMGWLPFEVKRPRVVFKGVQYPAHGTLHPLNDIYGRMKYICKGIDPAKPIHDIRPVSQGKIMGRRWGISQAIKTN